MPANEPSAQDDAADTRLPALRTLEEWLARRLCSYAHLAEADDDRYAWVLTGEQVGRGPDSERLVAHAREVAVLDDDVLEEARRLYEQRFDVGRDSRGA